MHVVSFVSFRSAPLVADGELENDSDVPQIFKASHVDLHSASAACSLVSPQGLSPRRTVNSPYRVQPMRMSSL